mmetsp:Transcript_25196/g.37218  ORF Transcript_25196/g.37218 Transcript_25196/m.37218 type:complete len:341 (-) Transcript_25196:127-1149(-)|eukprot:CAMPEP_0194218204 /NCGR_PEP_ID=MMETSP0156-20130528/23241_1 /TAXON_ID=33649 /ORGANISM="Thalassionema nitzschioides, Strain L26-B" /LENGTH=340 /DNA_ID=CAMNT_0038947475 /DNA_START=1 /DNA_END=1023 /DNA_ORIENTATION=-
MAAFTHDNKRRYDGSCRKGITIILVSLNVFIVVFLHKSLGEQMDWEQVATAPDGINDKDDYELARKQSYGFFDDIPTKSWKLLQTIQRDTFPNYYIERKGEESLLRYSNTMAHSPTSLGKTIDFLAKSNWWYGENFQVEFNGCTFMRRVSSINSHADGPKWVCDPHRLKKKTYSNSNKSCLVYSVGSNGNTMFEEGILEATDHSCEIHTFDLSGWNRRNGNFSEKLSRVGATFHNWGFGTPAQARRNPKVFKTLKETMALLGHTNRKIDIFKIDCEWCEWSTYTEWLQDDIHMTQILVETHNAPLPNAKDFFFQLHDAGYVIFSKEANYQNGAGGVEYAF